MRHKKPEYPEDAISQLTQDAHVQHMSLIVDDEDREVGCALAVLHPNHLQSLSFAYLDAFINQIPRYMKHHTMYTAAADTHVGCIALCTVCDVCE